MLLTHKQTNENENREQNQIKMSVLTEKSKLICQNIKLAQFSIRANLFLFKERAILLYYFLFEFKVVWVDAKKNNVTLYLFVRIFFVFFKW